MKNKNIKLFVILLFILLFISGILFLAKTNINKLKSSIVDPITNNICNEIIEASIDGSYIVPIGKYDYYYHDQYYDDGCSIDDVNGSGDCYYSAENMNNKYAYSYNYGTPEDVINSLKDMSSSHCPLGYTCQNKPTLPNTIEEDSCTVISADKIMTNLYLEDFVLENAEGLVDTNNLNDVLKNFYAIYNSDYFCPQQYCVANTYEINLDPNGGTGGTEKIYEKYNTAYYLDESETLEMTSQNNPIEIPRKTFSITYDANNQGATFSEGPTSINSPFIGYFDKQEFDSSCFDYNNGNSGNIYYNDVYGPYPSPFGDYNIITYNFYEFFHDRLAPSNLDSLIAWENCLTSTYLYTTFIDYNGYLVDYEVANHNPFYLYRYYVEDNGYNFYSSETKYNDDTSREYKSLRSNNTLYAQYDLAILELPEITKENNTCFWTDQSKGLDFNPGNTSIPITDDTTLTAVCIPNPKLTIINMTCDSDGTNCSEYSREERYPDYSSEEESYQHYGYIESICPEYISYYNYPDCYDVTYDGNHTLTFYNTRYYSSSSPFDNYISSDYNGISVNSSNTEMYFDGNEYSSSDYDSLVVWPAGESGRGENNMDWISKDANGYATFNYSYFNSSMSGYDASYNGKYGTYFASFANSGTDTDDHNYEIRPYIQVKYIVDGQPYGTTQVKQPNNQITILNAPSKNGYNFLFWRAYTEGVNSTGFSNTTYTACSHEAGGFYDDYSSEYIVAFFEGQGIDYGEWHYSNYNYPCPTNNSYVNNILTIYLQAVYQKDPWLTYE